MALQWLLLGVVAGVEAAILLLLSAPLPRAVSEQILEFVRMILQPGLAVIPFSLFQLLEVYWKYEHRINCSKDVCTPLERDRFQRSIYKSERNALLAISAAYFYWLLFSRKNAARPATSRRSCEAGKGGVNPAGSTNLLWLCILCLQSCLVKLHLGTLDSVTTVVNGRFILCFGLGIQCEYICVFFNLDYPQGLDYSFTSNLEC